MRWLAVVALVCAGPAWAADEIDCTAPTGIGTRACTFPEGQIVVETSLFDGTIDHAGGLHTDSVLLGDTVLHVGLRSGIEAQLGWTPFDHERTTNVRTGETMSTTGIGDVSIGGKLVLLSADSHAVSLSIQPALTIPVGDLKLGSKGVGGDLVVPLSYDLGEALTLNLTPEIAWTGDRDDRGRHLAYGSVIGIDWTIAPNVSTALEYRLERDEDPAFRRTKQVIATSVGWMPFRRLQLNAGIAAGLNARSPRAELIVGLTRSFR